MTEDDRLSPTERQYARVNDLWPADLPPLTAQEAISAAKRLYRLGFGSAFKGEFKITSGNRNTWIRNRVFVVNPDKGWRDLVHAISHLTHYKKHRDRSGHHWTHIGFERMMTEKVISSGWLDGRLRRETPDKPDTKTLRYRRVLVRIENWEAKKRRADRALEKLYQSKRYYERQDG